MSNQKTDDSVIIEIIERGQLGEILVSPLGLVTLISCMLLVGLYVKKGFSRRKKLARARWAGDREKLAARRQACKQLKEGVYNETAAYISTVAVDLPIRVKGKYLLRVPPSSKRLYLPDINRGVFVGGANGSGKSYSCINPLLRSFFDRGEEVYLYDNKYHLGNASQSARVAGYALERGYEVYVFAPGYPESGVINPLDFLKDEWDGIHAEQLAITINANSRLSKGDSSKGDAFFREAADMLAKALFQYAKGCQHRDILMCFAILTLSDLPKRLFEADEVRQEELPTAFFQLISSKDSEKTAASIVASALSLFNRFVDWNLLPVFCGSTTIPLEPKRRKLIIFATSQSSQEVVSPLIAAIIHLLVIKNTSKKRSNSLVCCLDEFPSIYLPRLSNWLNEKREQGFIGILGLQEYSQLEKNYGKETANILFTGCVTKFLFSTGNEITANKFSKYLGEEEVINTRINRTRGKGEGSSTTQNESAKRPLFEVSQFNTLPKGKAVVISPGFASKNQANLPLLHEFEMTDEIKQLEARSVQIWNDYKTQLIAGNETRKMSYSDLKKRRAEAEWLLPLPKNEEDKNDEDGEDEQESQEQAQIEDNRQFMNDEPQKKRPDEGEDEWWNQNPCPKGTLTARNTTQKSITEK